MTKKVLLCGNDLLIQSIIRHNVFKDQPFELIWYQREAEFSQEVNDILSSAVLAQNLSLTGTNTPPWGEIDLLLVGQPEFAEDLSLVERMRVETQWTQFLINQAMANNFSGKVCFLSANSEQQVVSAIRFSGLPASSVFGIGTAQLSLLAEQLVSKVLHVDVRQIQVNVVGTLSRPIPAWSRGRVAGIPLLSLIAQENSLFNQDNLDEIEAALQHNSLEGLLPAMLNSLDQIFGALFSSFGLIITLAHQVELGDSLIAISEPVLLSAQGLSTMPLVNLSENENQQLGAAKAEVLAQIQELMGGK
ncbi:L-lactate dehydrogenase [Ligilactobacillus salitolerans]|uniref:L-lactate dehydrogenase n=1 Tax=Ligilactobacillus salitolerans TaxID=1808352 RepID=A0A401IQY1_9LACO|nr:lactate dehydrogenase [Ligilactobacillus salitolerans]GBG93923.1 L-lactate dehydrogenase [Ligilactobacillus salitolerans]